MNKGFIDSKKNGKKITHLQIFGERNSGTNYLQNLINNNLSSPLLNSNLDWKHGFINGKKLDVPEKDSILSIVLFKDPYAWLSSMHERPHHAPQLFNKEFSIFIRSEWACYFGKNYVQRSKMLDIDPLHPSDEILRERNPETKLRLENIIHLRNHKNKSFLTISEIFENFLFLRYEELLLSPELVLNSISKLFDIETKDIFNNISGHYGKNLNLNFDRHEYYQKRRYFEKYSEQDIKFVNSILNEKYENIIGYHLVNK